MENLSFLGAFMRHVGYVMVWGCIFVGEPLSSSVQYENLAVPLIVTYPAQKCLIYQVNPPIVGFLKSFVKKSRLCLTFNTIYARPFQNAGTKRSLSAKKNVFHGFDRTNKGPKSLASKQLLK